MTAIVFEIKNGKALLMKNGGEFTTVTAQKDWEKGDVVALQEPKVTFINFKLLATVAASLVLLTIAVFAGYQFLYTESDIISMDINPSIELTVNRKNMVTSVSGFNADGEALIEQLEITGKAYQDALETILKSDAVRPYLEANQYLTFAVYSKDRAEEILQSLREIEKSVWEIEPDITVSCRRVSAETVTNAHHYEMTPGKYSAIEELLSLLGETDISTYTQQTIGEIEANIQQCKHEQKRQGYGHNGSADSAASGDDTVSSLVPQQNGNGRHHGENGAGNHDGAGNAAGNAAGEATTDGSGTGKQHGKNNNAGQGNGMNQGTGQGNGMGQGKGQGN